MANIAKSKGLPFQPFHRPDQRVGGSAWLSSGALLAIGVALPGLMFAWYFNKIVNMGPVVQSSSLLAVDATFILTATAFLSTGSLLGIQRYGRFAKYPGPFVEQDGSYFPPAFVQTYVMVVALLLSVICPSIAFSYLVWSNRAGLAICTLGVYLLETAAQLISETAFVRKESVMWPQVPQVYQTYRIWQLIRGCYLVSVLRGPDWLWALQAGLIVIWVFNFGVVMSWSPWLYRWQTQSDSLDTKSAKSE